MSQTVLQRIPHSSTTALNFESGFCYDGIMNTTGIIAEYNPFHNGHLYHLEKARKLSGADYVIIVLSPDFVQRGEPSLLDKWVRTRMALACGADLVLELPVRSAAGSAEYFAHGGVSILSALGVVNALSFGCETDRLEPLMEYALFLSREEPDEYRKLLKEMLREGKSFAEARCLSYLKYRRGLSPSGRGCSFTDNRGSSCADGKDLSEDENVLAGILRSPNNILAAEYLKANIRYGSSMQPFPVPRAGAGYHDLDRILQNQTPDRDYPVVLSEGASSKEGYASAAGIRRALSEGISVKSQLPSASYHLLSEEMSANRYITSSDLDLPLHLKLAQNRSSLADYADVSEDLANRINHLLPLYTGFEQFAALLKTKQIAHTRVKRALLHILLDMKKQPEPGLRIKSPGYARVLGFCSSAGPLLREIKEHSSIPLITRLPSDDRMPEALQEDLKAADLWELLASHKTGAPVRCERKRRIIVI